MVVKQKSILVCDNCKKEINQNGNFVTTEDVPHEGCSTIETSCGKKCYHVGGQHYCQISCLVSHIKKVLT